jgi:TonB-linked SusC/RagA family outer membrane protein
MKKMSHKYLLCAGLAMAQIATGEAFGFPLGIAPLERPGAFQEVVRGKVTGPDGNPVPGANVSVKGSRHGATTASDGSFSITASKGDILVITSVGYAGKQVKVGDGDVAVSLVESTKQLDEVVVTALGIKKQARSLGYSTTEVNGGALTDSREQNLGNALTGQVAGVNVAGVANGPMGTSRVVIRGNSSLTGNNQPLYVIDGVPFDNQNLGGFSMQYGGQDYGDGLSGISPDDIESVQVLKGVAASALYGFRGGNGAILITTKSGARNKGMNIELNNNLVFNSVIDEREYQYTYGQGLQGVKPTSQAAAIAAPYDSWGARIDGSQAVNFLGDSYAYSPYKKNFENFFQTATTNQTAVSLSGANDKGHFRLGLSNSYNGTVIPNSNMKNQGVNFNGTFNITNRLQMTLTADYTFEQVKNRASFSDAPGNVIAGPLYLANTFDIRWMKNHQTNPNGSELLPGSDIYFENPYYIAYQYQNKTNRNRLTGGLTLKYNILDWLYLQGQVTRDGYIFDVTNITPSGVPYTGNGVTGGNMTQYEINYHEINGNAMIGIDKSLGSSFHLSANAGINEQDNVVSDYGLGAVPTLVNGLNPQGPAGPFTITGLYTANNIANKPAASGYAHYRVNSVYGSVDLGYKNFLFLTATARNDWFSTLAINSDHYLYPSVAGSFVFSDALHMPSWISFGKLRASYAAASNGTSPYQNSLLYNLASYTISGQSVGTVASNIIPDANLEPVRIAEEEVGLNMEFLESRVGFDLALYNKHTTDDIVQSTVSPTSGYDYQVQNIGQIRNRGIELLLNLTPVRSRNFTWNATFNYAHNSNKVLSLGGLNTLVINGAYPRWGSEVNISNVVGLPYSQIMGYAYSKDAKGNTIFSSGGANNPVTAGEPVPTGVVPLGSGIYSTTAGFNNEFTFKGITLSFLLDGKFGAKIYSGTNLLLYDYGLQKTTLQGREGGFIGKGVDQKGNVNATAVNAQTYFQDISATGADHIAQEFVYDASFIKLRSLSIGYSLPASMLRGSFVKGVRLSLVGRNLAILMKHVPNIDPESNLNASNGQGLELSGYPAFRSYGFNVNVKF